MWRTYGCTPEPLVASTPKTQFQHSHDRKEQARLQSLLHWALIARDHTILTGEPAATYFTAPSREPPRLARRAEGTRLTEASLSAPPFSQGWAVGGESFDLPAFICERERSKARLPPIKRHSRLVKPLAWRQFAPASRALYSFAQLTPFQYTLRQTSLAVCYCFSAVPSGLACHAALNTELRRVAASPNRRQEYICASVSLSTACFKHCSSLCKDLKSVSQNVIRCYRLHFFACRPGRSGHPFLVSPSRRLGLIWA